MTLHSMTGHGQGVANEHGAEVRITLSTVNRKNCDIALTLPNPLHGLESEVHTLIRSSITRGRLTGDIAITFEDQGALEVMIDRALAKSFVTSLRQLSGELELKDDLTLSALLNHPEIVQVVASEVDRETYWPVIKNAFQAALDSLVAMRRDEGKALEADLRDRVKLMSDLVTEVEELGAGFPEICRQRLMTKLETAGLPVDLEDDRLVREIAYYAERSDITEEITRLRSHLDQVLQLMDSDEAVGRQLDFLSQELFREVNTIASKAGRSTIANAAIHFKSELEKFREQVQNVE